MIDTGATCSLINSGTYQQYCKLQPLELQKSDSITVAVNGEKIKLSGYTNFEANFDIQGDYLIKIKAWVSAKNGCKLNILRMNFVFKTTKSIEFSTPKSELKMTQE